jgi:pSer/pThr/pTyr-binding forkhead associated (FHA) protein
MPDLRAGVAPRLIVVAAMGHEPGTSWDVGQGATMGRADGSQIRVDDPFASSAHARIFSRGDFMYVEDMGSTNGTYLNGRQLRTAERLKPGDVIRIGDSEYRYQE